MHFKYESAGARLAPRDDGLPGYHVYWVRAMTPGLGHGSKVMRMVIEFADKEHVPLYLVAQQFGPARNAMNNKQLEAFYSHFGFVKVPEPKRPTHMVRQPSQESRGI